MSELQTGWVLAEDVHDLNGRFLMGKDCELSDKHIRVLRAWGVNAVEVNGENISESDADAAIPEALLNEVQAEQEARFMHADLDDAFTRELFILSTRYIAQRRLGN